MSIKNSEKRILKPDSLISWMKYAIPPLDSTRYKGQAGKICVVGGSKEYTGAPYFAAISALLCGADLVHVICPEEAASVIKSYSPELIVHPVLCSSKDECHRWIDKMHAVVLGPGLGHDTVQQSTDLIRYVRDKNIPLVIDADGLHLVAANPSVIAGYNRVILTPNINEAKMLYQTFVPNGPSFSFELSCYAEIARELGHVTIVAKGMADIITDGITDISCTIQGSPRRCGGQGDLLSGSMAAMLSWCYSNGSQIFIKQNDNLGHENVTAAYSACALTRICSQMAFDEKQRATITSDMINHIGIAFQELFRW